MHPPYHIHYLTRKDIDTEKWDACLDHMPLIYARTWYLDHMAAGQWDALILGDYEAIMPLPWRKKWGVRYLYQPVFTQQLGIFSKKPITSQLIEAWLEALGRYYKFAAIFLNHQNAHPSLKPYVNLVLDLNSSYDALTTNYKTDLLSNLKKADRSSLQYLNTIDLPQTLALFQKFYSPRLPHIKEDDYTRFQALCNTLLEKGQLLMRGIRDSRQQLLATALLPRDKHRLYLLQSTVTPAGRKVGANHFLLDRIIHDFAETPLVLDFEGSEEPGIAHFYRNFGSRYQPYYYLWHNKLPWPLRLFK